MKNSIKFILVISFIILALQTFKVGAVKNDEHSAYHVVIKTLFKRETNLTDKAREVLGNAVSVLNSMDGLNIWSSIADSWRKALRKNSSGITSVKTIQAGNVDSNELVQYFIPLIIMLACILVLAIGTLITSFFACCCCFKRCTRRKRKAYGCCNRVFSLLLYCFLVFSIFVGVITGLKGDVTMTSGLKMAIVGVNSLLTDTKSFGRDLSPVVNKTFITLDKGANGFSNMLQEFLIDSIENGPTLSSGINSMVVSMEGLSLLLKRSADTGDGIDFDISSLESQTAQLQQAISAFNTKLTALNSSVTDATGLFIISNVINMPFIINLTPVGIAISSGNTPSVSDSLIEIKTPNIPELAELKKNITSKFSGLTDNINLMLSNPESLLQVEIFQALDNSKSMASNVSETLSTEFMRIVSDAQRSTVGLFADLIKYDEYRAIGMGIVFGIPAFFAIVILILMVFRKPTSVKKTTVGGLWKYFIIYILAIILLIVAVVTGEACNAIFEEKGTGLRRLMERYIGKEAFNVTAAIEAKDDCRNNVSLLTAISKSNILGSSSTKMQFFNLTKTVEEITNPDKIYEIIDSVDTVSTMPLDSVGRIVVTFTSERRDAVLSDLNILAKRQAFDPTLYPIIDDSDMTSLNNLVTTLTNLRNTLTAADFTFTPSQASIIRGANAVTTYQGMIDGVLDDIRTVFTDTNSARAVIENNRQNIKARISTLQDAVNRTMTVALGASELAQTVIDNMVYVSEESKSISVKQIPVLRSNFRKAGDKALYVLNSGTKCDMLANDFDIIQNAFCTSILASVDSMWMAFLLLGILGTIGFPIYIAAANRVADRHADKPDPKHYGNEGDYTERGMGLKKGSMREQSRQGSTNNHSRQISNKKMSRQSSRIPDVVVVIAKTQAATDIIPEDAEKELEKKNSDQFSSSSSEGASIKEKTDENAADNENLDVSAQTPGELQRLGSVPSMPVSQPVELQRLISLPAYMMHQISSTGAEQESLQESIVDPAHPIPIPSPTDGDQSSTSEELADISSSAYESQSSVVMEQTGVPTEGPTITNESSSSIGSSIESSVSNLKVANEQVKSSENLEQLEIQLGEQYQLPELASNPQEDLTGTAPDITALFDD